MKPGETVAVELVLEVRLPLCARPPSASVIVQCLLADRFAAALRRDSGDRPLGAATGTTPAWWASQDRSAAPT